MTIGVSGSSVLILLAFGLILIPWGAEGFQPNGIIGRRRATHHLGFSSYSRKPLSVGLGTSRPAVQDNQRSAVLDWSFLDGVYLITCPNADPDGERVENAKEILDSVGLLDRLEVKEFDTDDEDRIRGCYTSHISVMKDIVGQSSKTSSKSKNPFDDFFGAFIPKGGPKSEERNFNALILEDNLALNGKQLKQAMLDSIVQYSRSDHEWDMIHLAYIPYVPDLKVSRTNNQDIVKLSCGVGSALGTTAYVINSKAMRTVLKDDRENGGFYLPIPDVMAKLFPETRYAVDPTIFVRAPDTKSLVNPQLDDLRSLLFQPVVATFVQRLLISTGLTTNALLPITIVLLLLASAASAVVTFDSFWSLLTTGSFEGPIFLPLLSASFSLFSLAIIVKGVMLAPSQDSS
jgi:GR25 family glycosyltransferase involved in LPS biosynthesis